MNRTIIITGGAGFIGSHVVRLFVNKYPDYHIINLDKLTYAGNLANLKDIENKPNYEFVKMDICDFDGVLKLMQEKKVDGIIHLAAESHVDRSIKDPFTFAQTNVMGTLSLLQAAKAYWESLPEKYEGKRFYHISTDEVYGALQMTHPEGIEPPFTTKASSGKHHLAYGEKFFTEDLKYQPHSPYSAAKASSDHFVRAFHDTFGLPTIVTNCSNNYGPYQFPEKLIPLFINNIRHRKPLPVYGKGENVRDWLYVVDHARAIDTIFHNGKIAETYNIGGFNEWKNIDIIKVVINTVDRLLGRKEGEDMDLITYVTDRAGHDLRYAIDSTKLQKELGWEPSLQFEEGIEETVKWYLDNQEWLDNVTSGDYQQMKKILLLGSGELGKEFVIAAMRAGQYVIACDRYDNAPAMQVADEREVFSMLDGDALEAIVNKHKPDIIVPEIEAIRTERLFKFEEQGIQVVPSARAVNFTMNRRAIRDLAAKELGLRTAKYFYAKTFEEFKKASEEIGFPCVVKPLMSSSGHGQSYVHNEGELEQAFKEAMEGSRGDVKEVIIEEFIDFDSECSSMVGLHFSVPPSDMCKRLVTIVSRGNPIRLVMRL